MKLLDYDVVRDFYNKHIHCWPDDLFSRMTTEYINKFVAKKLKQYNANAIILNAGSGGKTYPTAGTIIHLDIAENTIQNLENSFVGNIIEMPFENCKFDCVVCVGTVINYCEAEKALNEINRVLKMNGTLILEFERSGSGLVVKSLRNTPWTAFAHTYYGEKHVNLLYSEEHVNVLLKENGFLTETRSRFNTTIPLVEIRFSDEFAHRMTVFEPILRHIPILNNYSHNVIVVCKKTSHVASKRNILSVNRTHEAQKEEEVVTF